jgi:hypothetical protein
LQFSQCLLFVGSPTPHPAGGQKLSPRPPAMPGVALGGADFLPVHRGNGWGGSLLFLPQIAQFYADFWGSGEMSRYFVGAVCKCCYATTAPTKPRLFNGYLPKSPLP